MSKTCTTPGCAGSSGFGKDKNQKDGLSRRCKSCNARSRREWRHANPEKVNKITARYRRRNAKKLKAAIKKWRQRNPERSRSTSDAWEKRNPELAADYQLRYKYGIGLEEYEKLKKKSRGKCGACGSSSQKLFIDHCHKKRRVRGLLCHHCNSALGLLKDDPQRIRMLLIYLERTTRELSALPALPMPIYQRRLENNKNEKFSRMIRFLIRRTSKTGQIRLTDARQVRTLLKARRMGYVGEDDQVTIKGKRLIKMRRSEQK